MKYVLRIGRVMSAISVAAFVLFGILPNRSEAAAYTSQSFCALVLQFHLAGSSGTDAETSLDVKVQSLVEQISKSFTDSNKIRIAVCSFVDLDGKPSDFGIYLAEELITRLFQSGRFEVVERRLLDKALDEQKLSATGILDAASAQKLGSVLGVQAIVTGTLTDLQSTVKVNARIVSAQSGSVFAAASETISKTGDVFRLMSNTAGVASQPEVVAKEVPVSKKETGKAERPAPSGRFAKLESGVIKDSSTGLDWYVGPKKMSLGQAIKWTHGLDIDGGNWNIPTLDELRGLYQRGTGKHNIDPVFEPSCRGIISSDSKGTPEGLGEGCIWYFDFKRGEESACGALFPKLPTSGMGVFVVRQGK